LTELPGEALSRLAGYGRVAILDRVTSTNDFALALRDETAEPAIVLARSQTRGRGRFHRTWYSDDASLCFSLLLSRRDQGFPDALLSQLAGLALCRAVEATSGAKPLIRWPNDMMLGDRKLAGILCEARGSKVAVGFGLNVNQTGFPESLPDAISLLMATGRTCDRLALLEACVRETLTVVRQAASGEKESLLAEIKGRSSILHHRVEVKTLLRTHIGTCIDLDTEGRIVLRTDPGRLVVLGAGQVRRLR
jgi:BirA family biotin operon repressor/biotin-[acetyl-CoA-carboxylase] ligase